MSYRTTRKAPIFIDVFRRVAAVNRGQEDDARAFRRGGGRERERVREGEREGRPKRFFSAWCASNKEAAPYADLDGEAYDAVARTYRGSNCVVRISIRGNGETGRAGCARQRGAGRAGARGRGKRNESCVLW